MNEFNPAEDAGAAALRRRDAVRTLRRRVAITPHWPDRVTEFLGAPSGDAIDLWFGAPSAARVFRIDTQALRDAG